MPEIIGDAALYQNPLDAAAATYAATPPAEGAPGAALATIEEGPAAYLRRGAERGIYAGSSPASQGMAALWQGSEGTPAAAFGIGGEPLPGSVKTPTISAADANARFAPMGPDGTPATITSESIPEGVAQVLGQQRADQLRRESILQRYNANANPVGSFALETLASFGDPFNAGSLLLPGIGGEALATRLGGGILARTGARFLAGAATGAAQQGPLSALRYGLSQDEFADYSLHDAFRDIAFGAAGAAILNAGVVGGVSEFLRWRRGEGPLPAGVRPDVAAAASPIVGADAATDRTAMQAAIGEALDARPVDLPPIFARANTPEDLLGRPPGRPDDVIDFLMQQGGVQDEGGELRAMDLHRPQKGKFGTLVRRNGLSLDYAREVAEEAGYLPEGSTISDLLGAIDATARGNPAFIPEQAAEWREYMAARRLGPQPEAFDPNDMFDDFVDEQRLQQHDGWAPGIGRDELSQATDEIYRPVASGEAAEGVTPVAATTAHESVQPVPSRLFPAIDEPLALMQRGELTAQRAEQTAQQLHEHFGNAEEEIFGDRAEQWRQLQRRSNAAWNRADDAKAREYDRRIAEIEKSVPQSDLDYLSGVGATGPVDPDMWRDLAVTLRDLEASPEDAADVVATQLRHLPAEGQAPTQTEREAIAVIGSALQQTEARGGDPLDLLKNALLGRGERYGGGADAAELVTDQMKRLRALMETPPAATAAASGETSAPMPPEAAAVEAAPQKTATRDHELSEAEAQAARIDLATLLPEERADLEVTARGLGEAQEISAGIAEAAACIGGAGGAA